MVGGRERGTEGKTVAGEEGREEMVGGKMRKEGRKEG